MKHANQILLDLVVETDKKTKEQQRTREAARKGIAEAYRILGMEPKPEDDERHAA